MKRRKIIIVLAIVSMLTVSACGVLEAFVDHQDHVQDDMADMDHEHTDVDADHEHADVEDMDHEHADGEEADVQIPNDGAVIHIVSPADGATVSAHDFVVEIETENFTLGEDGNHWHVLVDGVEWGMIMGVDTSFALNGVEPGEHQVEVRLSNGMHEELAEGDSITVTIQ